MNEAKTYISEKVKNASGVTINPATEDTTFTKIMDDYAWYTYS